MSFVALAVMMLLLAGVRRLPGYVHCPGQDEGFAYLGMMVIIAIWFVAAVADAALWLRYIAGRDAKP